jgi:hypothetical protein
VGFKPFEGPVFAKVKFVGEKCTLKETAIETTKGDLAIAGIAENAKELPIELEVASRELLGTAAFVRFPETLLKTEFVEKAKMVSEVKEKLDAFGKAVTKITGRIKLVLTKAAWGIFGVER